jgi:hypothetical protein
MKQKYNLTEITKHLEVPFYLVRTAVKHLELNYISINSGVKYYSREQRDVIIRYIKNEFLTVYKPVYVHIKETYHIYESKLNYDN